jgi:hypothetical protein
MLQGSLINRQSSPQDFDEHFARAHNRQQHGCHLHSTWVGTQPGGTHATGGPAATRCSDLATFVGTHIPKSRTSFGSALGRPTIELERSQAPSLAQYRWRGVPWLHMRLDTQPRYVSCRLQPAVARPSGSSEEQGTGRPSIITGAWTLQTVK